MAASACTPNPLKKYAGTFCTNSPIVDECFYLYEDGTGVVDDEGRGISGRVYWELIDNAKALITADTTSVGKTITFSEDGNEFLGTGSIFQFQMPLTYKKQGLTATPKENKALITLSCALNSLSSPIKAIYDKDNAYFKAGDISPQEWIAPDPEDAVFIDTEAYEQQMLYLKKKGTYSMERIKEIMEIREMPTIQVNKGDLIAREGEAISQQALDVMDYFGYSRKSTQYLIKESWNSCMSKSNS